MEQLIIHLFGDYVTQTDWMAVNKTKRWYVAFIHAIVYSLPFLLLSPSVAAFLTILISHAVIDKLRLARYVIFCKNLVTDSSLKWKDCNVTGFHYSRPEWLTVWLMIITDNTMHLAINYAALRWL